MPIFYRNQNKIEALKKKLGAAYSTARLSDLMGALYGGRGNKADETNYLQNQNGDAAGVNRKDSDAWVTFANQHGVTAINRADQAEREFYLEGTYP